MVARVSVALLLLAGAVSANSQTPPAFDPVGTWSVATQADDGTPMTVGVTIAGKPGAYRGEARTGLDRVLPLRDLATTPTGMIAIFDLPAGSIVVMLSQAGAKYEGAWAEVTQTYPLTASRGK